MAKQKQAPATLKAAHARIAALEAQLADLVKRFEYATSVSEKNFKQAYVERTSLSNAHNALVAQLVRPPVWVRY